MGPTRTIAAAVWTSIILGLFAVPSQRALAQTLPPNFSDALVLGGWSEPVGATWDANGRMYVWEKAGRVWIVDGGVRLPAPLVDLSEEVGNWRDHGMLGFALDPDFISNGRIYLMYVVDRHHLMHHGTAAYDPNANAYFAATIMRITRYAAMGPSFTEVSEASRYVLLGETKETGAPTLHESHTTGTLVFGNDGTLLASMGDGASTSTIDVGSAPDTYWEQALADGIMRPQENVGSMRSQLVDSFNGKVLRMDPNTGDGVPGNPWFDPAAPRAPRSRVWALGLRNPFRMTIRPGSGGTDPTEGRPGTLYVTDVGWGLWEDLNVCIEGGMNFGWPMYEGMELLGTHMYAITENPDAPNPLYDGVGCRRRYFTFQDLLKQDTPQHLNGHPNPCDPSLQIPAHVPKHFHARPAIDWRQDDPRSRTGGFAGTTAITYDLDDPGSPVPGPRFGGACAIAGPWADGLNLPVEYRSSSFHGDFSGGWIRRFRFDAQDRPVSVHDFGSGLGNITWIGAGPDGCLWYIRYNSGQLRRICHTLDVDLPPVAVAAQDVQYGPGPLAVQFTGSGSSDPEGGPLTFQWDFGDGQTSPDPDPAHVFTAPPGTPLTYPVTLTVTDAAGQTNTASLIVSVNNTPPQVAITSFADSAFYPVGVDTIFQLLAAVTDVEHGPAELAYAWRVALHHNTHAHPEPADHNPSTTATISGVGCDGETYYYVVALTVTDAGGLSTTVTHTLLPRCHAIPPTAIISAIPAFGESPLFVQFDGTSSYDFGTIMGYHWDFGDGTSSTDPSPGKVFIEPGTYPITLTVTDDDGLAGQASTTVDVITFEPPQCAGPAGSILRERWDGITGGTVADLENSPDYPRNPSSTSYPSSFQGPVDDGDNYGTRMRGWIVPPATGDYVFIATSDDESLVYLGVNADPRFKRPICGVPGATWLDEYDKYPAQTSGAIPLVGGRHYYVEMLHKEGGGGDHLALHWRTPLGGNVEVVPGTALVPWQDCPPGVLVRVGLQGPWDDASGMMRDDLRAAGLLPLTEPYTALGFALPGGGGETVAPERLMTTGRNALVDWVVVELRDKDNPAQVVAACAALVERDGDVTGADGHARLLFNVPAGDYFVAVRHRNHLGAMTREPLALSPVATMADFTSPVLPAYGTGARNQLANGGMALWAGQVVRDGVLKYAGTDNDRDAIMVRVGGVVPTATVTGYFSADVTMDGTVKYVGAGNDRDAILRNIGGSVPTAVRLEQLP